MSAWVKVCYNNTLSHLQTAKEEHLAAELLAFHHLTYHQSGCSYKNADALSRQCVVEPFYSACSILSTFCNLRFYMLYMEICLFAFVNRIAALYLYCSIVLFISLPSLSVHHFRKAFIFQQEFVLVM